MDSSNPEGSVPLIFKPTFFLYNTLYFKKIILKSIKQFCYGRAR